MKHEAHALILFEAHKLDCAMKHFPSEGLLGSWFCGYVRIPEGHPWFGMTDSYNLAVEYPEVHGGVTYGRLGLRDKAGWWIGFDTCHGDIFTEGMTRDETENLARQVAEAWKFGGQS